MKILSVVGARPNFMKIAPFIRAIEKYNKSIPTTHIVSNISGINEPPPIPHSSVLTPVEHILVHTGQHYDDSMSKAFFEDLNIPEADINLGIGSGTHAEQVGLTMIAFEKVLKEEKPDWVVVVGDVNATLACSVTAKKEWIKVCHIEAGLRSGDLTMPEEINRLVTDRLSDLLLAPDIISIQNLKAEGVPDSRIRFVGNIMIDTLEANRKKAKAMEVGEIVGRMGRVRRGGDGKIERCADCERGRWGEGRRYAVVTLHRPSNVDAAETFAPIVDFLADEVAGELTVLWPVHPRTKKKLTEFGLFEKVSDHKNIILMEPLGYFDMLRLNMGATVMLTDSGGLQEECTVLGTPCLTLRNNTERPVTLQEHGGASVLVGNSIDAIRKTFRTALAAERVPVRPELWDGKTAERCLEAILGYQA